MFIVTVCDTDPVVPVIVTEVEADTAFADRVKVALVEAPAMLTLLGTTTAGFELVRKTGNPYFVVFPVRFSVPVSDVPPCREVAGNVICDRVGA